MIFLRGVDTSKMFDSNFFVAVRSRKGGHRHKYRITYDAFADGSKTWVIDTGGSYENRRGKRNFVGKVSSTGDGRARSDNACIIINKILKDPAACRMSYSMTTNNCGVCSRLLENKRSVKLGIGPVCRGSDGEGDSDGNDISDPDTEDSTDSDGTNSEGYDSLNDFLDDSSSSSSSSESSESSVDDDDDLPLLRLRSRRPSSNPGVDIDLDALIDEDRAIADVIDLERDPPSAPKTQTRRRRFVRPQRSLHLSLSRSVSSIDISVDSEDDSVTIRLSRRKVLEDSEDEEGIRDLRKIKRSRHVL